MLNNYPLLHYPEMYLLEGGYRSFYNKFKVRATCALSSVHNLCAVQELCTPQAYVEMRDKNFTREMSVYRKQSHSRPPVMATSLSSTTLSLRCGNGSGRGSKRGLFRSTAA
jgi:hypothetical protein